MKASAHACKAVGVAGSGELEVVEQLLPLLQRALPDQRRRHGVPCQPVCYHCRSLLRSDAPTNKTWLSLTRLSGSVNWQVDSKACNVRGMSIPRLTPQTKHSPCAADEAAYAAYAKAIYVTRLDGTCSLRCRHQTWLRLVTILALARD